MAIPGATRRLVARRAENRCEYCHLPAEASEETMQIEHVRARKHGGGDDPANLALACVLCNLHKGTDLVSHDPLTDAITPLFDPRTMAWTDHFAADGAHVVGLTPEGRATARMLHMNDRKRLGVRAMLAEAGEWP